MTAWECSQLKEQSLHGKTFLEDIPLIRRLGTFLTKPVCGYASPGFLAPICPDKKTGPAHMTALPLNILSGAEELSFSRSSFRRLLNELADGGDLTRLADWHKKDYGF